MFALVVRFDLTAGAGPAFDALVDETLRLIRARSPSWRRCSSHVASPHGKPERVLDHLIGVPSGARGVRRKGDEMGGATQVVVCDHSGTWARPLTAAATASLAFAPTRGSSIQLIMATDLTPHEWAEMDAEATRSAHGGWISPEGRFWPCRDLFHSPLASRIVRELQLPNTFSNMCLLEDSRWVHVMDDGTVHRSLLHSELTQAQLDALFDIASAHPSMRANLMTAINTAPGAVADRDQ